MLIVMGVVGVGAFSSYATIMEEGSMNHSMTVPTLNTHLFFSSSMSASTSVPLFRSRISSQMNTLLIVKKKKKKGTVVPVLKIEYRELVCLNDN